MANPKRNAKPDETVQPTTSHGVERAINVLALLLVKDTKQNIAIDTLARAGFKAGEIAALLGTSPNTVSVTLSKAKKAKGRK